MVPLFAFLLAVHAFIHLPGFVIGAGLSPRPRIVQPISRRMSSVWLAAAVLFLAAAASLFAWPRWWWLLGAAAIGVSMIAIASAWRDARFGTIVNAVVLVGVVFGFLTQGPVSLRAAYERDVARQLSNTRPATTVDESELARLPGPVQRYLRTSGVAGSPRPRNMRVLMHGRIRGGRAARWMPLRAEQYNFFDRPARFFYLDASMRAVPVQGYHRYAGPSATMDVKAAGLVRVAGGSGAEMDQGETVTMFNDMCVLAPATLLDPAIVWEPVDGRTARAAFTNAGRTIHADLIFRDNGELADFRSDDRFQMAGDGTGARRVRWSTPLGEYRTFGGVRLASGGEARWEEPDGAFAYIQLTFDSVEYDVPRR